MLIDGKEQKHILTKPQKENRDIAVPGLSERVCVPSVHVLPQTHAHVPDVRCHHYHCKHSQKYLKK